MADFPKVTTVPISREDFIKAEKALREAPQTNNIWIVNGKPLYTFDWDSEPMCSPAPTEAKTP